MKHKLSVFSSLCALFVLIAASREVISCSRYALRLCAELIVPSLFPFFLITELLTRLGFLAWLGNRIAPVSENLFRVSGVGASALIVGLFGGYPMGAVTVASLLRGGMITREEAEHLLFFSNNTGPAFLVGAVGVGVFGSSRIGLMLYAVHSAAALLSGILLRGWRKEAVHSPVPVLTSPPSFALAFTEAVRQAVSTVLNVCGFVVCFGILTGLLTSNGFFDALIGTLSRLISLEPDALRAVLCGFFELGSGIGALRGLAPEPIYLALASAIVGWGGISVQFQALAQLSDLDIKAAPLFAGRLMSAIWSFLLCLCVQTLKT